MISCIITAFKEERTIGLAVLQIAKQISEKDEIIVVAPDEETLEAAEKEAKVLKIKNLITLKDPGKGKPAALNIAVSKAKGDILILTDGDVSIDDSAVSSLLEKMKDLHVGAISGRPVSTNSMNNKYGFWAYLLTEIANERRLKAISMKKRFFCSGYLFAIRKTLFPYLKEELLSEDGYISHNVYEKGCRIDYAESALVYVKYPNNFKDWIKQKKRSAGGYNQIKEMLGISIRSFTSESKGAFGLLRYVHNFKQLFWLFELFIARVYLWFVIYKDINLKKKHHREIWERVESTK